MNVMAIARKLPSGSEIPCSELQNRYNTVDVVSKKHMVTKIEAEPARCKYTLWDGLQQVFRDMTDRAKGVNDRTYVNPDACVDES
ncbi:hypothetical protein GQ457_10G027730 [Hibiscus cannabinus]